MRIRNALPTLAVLSLVHVVPSSLAAQDAAPPAEQNEVYEQLLGHWKGSGKGVQPTPDGMQDFEWQGTSTYEKAMGGHFVRETTRIDVTGMGTLVFISYHGWDRERQQYVMITAGNLGGANFSEVHWPDEHTMLSAATMVNEGALTGERWITEIQGDTFELAGRTWIGTGETFDHVTGRMERIDSAEAIDVHGARAMMPVPEPMHRLASMAADYAVTGTVRMNGMEMPITAAETQRLLFGGSVLEMTISSPIPEADSAYTGWGAIAWNPAEKHYTSVYVDNMGQISHVKSRWVGKQLVGTSEGTIDGKPMVSRSIVTLGDDGRIAHVVENRMVGTDDPVLVFEGNYTVTK